MEGKNHKGLAITMSVVAGVLLIAVVSAVVWYNKAKTSGSIIVKPIPTITPASPTTSTPPAAASAPITIPTGARVVKGTYVQLPNGSVTDLYDYAKQ